MISLLLLISVMNVRGVTYDGITYALSNLLYILLLVRLFGQNVVNIFINFQINDEQPLLIIQKKKEKESMTIPCDNFLISNIVLIFSNIHLVYQRTDGCLLVISIKIREEKYGTQYVQYIFICTCQNCYQFFAVNRSNTYA